MGFIIPQNQRVLDWRKLSQGDLVILSLTLFLTPLNNFVQICCIVLSYNMWHWKGKSKFCPHTCEDSEGILKYEKKQQRTCAAEKLMSLWSKSHIQHQGQLVPFQSQPSNQYHNVLHCFHLITVYYLTYFISSQHLLENKTACKGRLFSTTTKRLWILMTFCSLHLRRRSGKSCLTQYARMWLGWVTSWEWLSNGEVACVSLRFFRLVDIGHFFSERIEQLSLFPIQLLGLWTEYCFMQAIIFICKVNNSK